MLTLREEILRWLRSGLSARDAAKLTGASPGYARRVRRESGIRVPSRHPHQTTLEAEVETASAMPTLLEARTSAAG